MIDFEKMNGLVPAIIQHATTKTILMLGYMNAEALAETEKTGNVVFFSRSKQRLWTKGETSGNFLKVVSIAADCDSDSLLIKALPAGHVCHTGDWSCFREEASDGFLGELERIIGQRKNDDPEQSYTASLFRKGINKIAQKVGEEAVELVIEAKDENADLFKNEAADLLFHYLILLNAKGFSLTDIEKILWKRNVKK